MGALNREKFLERITERIGEDTSDDALSFIEDMTDTFDELSASSGEDWKKKYEENDTMWREKYRERFFSGSKEDDKEDDEPPKTVPTTFEELFTTNK